MIIRFHCTRAAVFLLPQSGMYRWSRSQELRLMCHRCQNSHGLVAAYGTLKARLSSMPTNRLIPRTMSV